MTYCECPFPITSMREGYCGRCHRRLEPEPAICEACEGEGCTYAVYGQLDTYEDCERCGGTGEKRKAAK